MTELRAGAASDVGRVRPNNEDAPLVSDHVFAVADGMGGHKGGEVASQMAVAALRAHFIDHSLTALVAAVEHANESVFQQATDDPDLRGMGTTLVAVALVDPDDGEPEELGWVNVGDSRLYRLRDGELEQLSEDHSLVEEMVRDGQLSADEAATHPRRHIVTRALGIDPYVRVDSGTVIPFSGDRFVLCSDGLYEEVEDPRIAATLRRLADPTDAAQELVRLAVDGGGRDNVTVVVVDVVDDEGRARSASAALPANADPAGFTTEHPRLRVDTDEDDQGATRARPARKRRATRAAHRAAPRRRRMTWRLVAFVFAFLLVLGAAAGAVGWNARHTYYVGFSGDRVAIFKGRPGGVLWFDPTLERTTDIPRADVPPSAVAALTAGVSEGSLADAQQYVANLEEQISPTTTTSSTSSTTSSSTSSTSTSTSTTTSTSVPAN